MNELREQIDGLAADLGARALGVASPERFVDAPEMYHPESFLSGAQSVIVVGVHYPDACVDFCGSEDLQEMKAYGIAQVDMNILLDRLSFKIAKLLDERGFPSLSFSTSHIWRYRPFAGTDRSFTPDFCHRHAAVAAGLGEFGWNGLVISKDYGPRIRFNSIITTAELEPTPMYQGPTLCDKCMKCVKHCRMDTFRKEVTGMDTVKIGGHEFTFPHTNKWRCAWAEHFALALDVEIPDKIDEASVVASKHALGVYGGEIGNCLRQCMPPHLRDESEVTDVMRRKKPAAKTPAEFIAVVEDRIADRVEAFACISLDDLPEDIVIDTFDGAASLVLIGISVPGIMDKEIAHKMGRMSESLEDAEIFLKEEVVRQLGLISLEVAMLAEECGYDAMPRIDAPMERLAAHCKLGTFSGDGRILRTPEFGTGILFAAILTTVPLAAGTKRMRHTFNMPVDKEHLRSLAGLSGADLFGVTPLERLESFESVRKLKTLFPALKNAIVIGMHYPDAYLKGGESAPMGALGSYSFSQYQTHRELGFLAMDLSRKLASAGHTGMVLLDLCESGSKVLNVRGTPPPDTNFDKGMIGLLPYGFIPDMRCNRFAAVAAGLGSVGYNGSVLTDKYGPRQRFIVIATDLDLEADDMVEPSTDCGSCRKCIAACMTEAIDEAGTDTYRVGERTIEIPSLNQLRCDWAKRFGLSGKAGPAYMGSQTDAPAPETVTYDAIEKAFKERDDFQDHFLAIMEPCIKECPAPFKNAARFNSGAALLRKQLWSGEM